MAANASWLTSERCGRLPRGARRPRTRPQAVDLDALPVQVAHPGAEQVLELLGPVDVAVGQVRRLREGGEHRLVLGPHGRPDPVADLLLAPLEALPQDPPGLEPPGGAEATSPRVASGPNTSAIPSMVR